MAVVASNGPSPHSLILFVAAVEHLTAFFYFTKLVQFYFEFESVYERLTSVREAGNNAIKRHQVRSYQAPQMPMGGEGHWQKWSGAQMMSRVV